MTGAARGIGAAIAAELHGRGIRVALLDCDSAALHDTARTLKPNTGRVMSLCTDVSDVDGLQSAVQAVATQWRVPDILINNAARMVRRSVWDIDINEWDSLMATNLRSVLVLTRLCAASMRERGWGRVVNLASLAGQQGGLVMGAHYSTAKAGVLVLTKIFARELAPHGVTVNAITPAAIKTSAMDELTQQALTQIIARTPVGRLGWPEEVAALVGHLVRDESGYITGATFDVNGGAFMR
ncbi:SDR family NAD(P)-dependent oxidoreductase [Kibdelosporangium aridum]|uniref:SDR family NAD(P)-dependent oxidoreductase n=1 Tax=Kibdelosporangium aridum TaxID=2030 RepID=UPI0035EC3745